jgi:NifU-like protein involved in Fe-S cluster formation
MANLDDIYSTRILELAAAIPRTQRLAAPDATATAHSKLCGSTITVDLVVRDDRIVDFGQTVKACLLGQAAAAIVGREIVGMSPAELRAAAIEMRSILKEEGVLPTGRLAELRILEAVRDYKSRHASTMLVFDAIEKALVEIETKRGPGTTTVGRLAAAS